MIVSMSAGLGGAMLAEASLSYIGLGIQPPGASWGKMISRRPSYLAAIPPSEPDARRWFSLSSSLPANVLGDGLNDALNVRQSDS